MATPYRIAEWNHMHTRQLPYSTESCNYASKVGGKQRSDIYTTQSLRSKLTSVSSWDQLILLRCQFYCVGKDLLLLLYMWYPSIFHSDWIQSNDVTCQWHASYLYVLSVCIITQKKWGGRCFLCLNASYALHYVLNVRMAPLLGKWLMPANCLYFL